MSVQAALGSAALQQQRQLAGTGDAASQTPTEQNVTPDGFKVPLPKKLSGNQAAAVQQESSGAPEQPSSQTGTSHLCSVCQHCILNTAMTLSGSVFLSISGRADMLSRS